MKPCPFCGEKEDFTFKHGGCAQWEKCVSEEDVDYVQVRCQFCGACGPEAGYDGEAMTEWNERAER